MFVALKTAAVAGVISLSMFSWNAGAHRTPASPMDEIQKITLTGDEEQPAKVTSGASGLAVFTWDTHGGISYVVTVKDLSSMPSSVNIHGPADPDGLAPPIATLKLKAGVQSGIVAEGKLDAAILDHFKRETLKDLFDHGRAYVNVHTKNYPDGEIRGHFKH